MKIVIIAGGQGTRIASVNSEIPKAMIPVNSKPILEYQVELAKRYGFTEFIFIIGHLGNVIKEYFGDGSKWGVSIIYYHEEMPLGTAGAMPVIQYLLTEDFFVFYGDTIMDIALDEMLKFHKEHQSEATLFVHPNDHPYDSDIVEIDSNNRLIQLHLKPHPDNFISRNLVNASLFILSPRVIDYVPKDQKVNFEKHVFPKCLAEGMRMYGYVSAEYIKDMGTPDRYEKVCRDVINGKVTRLNKKYPRAAVFLDRDGVINKEVKFLHRAEQLELIRGAAEAIRLINQKGYLAIVITNQPVIARNMCTLEELDTIHATLETLLGKEHAYLDAIYYCPHHPDSGYPEERKEYKVVCNCRKPKPGMILQAAKDWNIDLSQSYLVGDSETDIQAGQNAGIRGLYKIIQNEPDSLLKQLSSLL
ncbi:HAD-IIIA family hydrolase [Bacteroides sp. AM10-21B]|jgi:mannose-1-phosphate guanylyltransferase/phosphomannomutase|uniref:HAD-IIIA family hydrolase n=1 Tax=Bacteroides sp. AM10-21B TaxID=2292001 RepID=UPI000E4D4BD5|nr:HAD-IIIA family hydrolase [Bacteroides sp. AM10-21B]RHJ49339.1 HAD-IIIA family hydrolase [Bacteroides sp. AM10-21B]